MTQTRRNFLKTTLAASAGITVVPFIANAAGHSTHVFESAAGMIKVHPIAHASIVLETPVGVLYVDPVGDASNYEGLPDPDLILITHHHGDHFSADTLGAIAKNGAPMITNPEVLSKLPEDMKGNASALANGQSSTFKDMSIDAIPAYNLTEERKNFHPQGRDNGYVLGIGDFKIYISGDTEDIPEMRALADIDLAFVCMNLPFTMPATAAADAVREFKPKYVYPYHYRGRDGGTQDPEEFAKLVGDAADVRLGEWY